MAILLDRTSGGPVVVTSQFGGVDIEKLAEKDPSAIKKYPLSIDEVNNPNMLYFEGIVQNGLGRICYLF